MLTEEQKRERNRQRCKQWHTKNAEYDRQRHAQWYEKNKDRASATVRRWQLENQERFRELWRVASWKRQGIVDMSIARYKEMLVACGGVCQLCERLSVYGGKVRALDVDHDHNQIGG